MIKYRVGDTVRYKGYYHIVEQVASDGSYLLSADGYGTIHLVSPLYLYEHQDEPFAKAAVILDAQPTPQEDRCMWDTETQQLIGN